MLAYLLISYIVVIFINKLGYVFNLITIYLMYIGTHSSIYLLALEEVSNYTFYQVIHPVSIKLKIAYLKSEIAQYTLWNFPEIYQSKEALTDFANMLDNRVTLTVETLNSMNAAQISEYAYTVVIAPRENSLMETFRNVSTIVLIAEAFEYLLPFAEKLIEFIKTYKS